MGTGLINDLYKSGLLEKYDLSTVEEIVTGGAKVYPQVTKKVNSILKNGEILQGYGIKPLLILLVLPRIFVLYFKAQSFLLKLAVRM